MYLHANLPQVLGLAPLQSDCKEFQHPIREELGGRVSDLREAGEVRGSSPRVQILPASTHRGTVHAQDSSWLAASPLPWASGQDCVEMEAGGLCGGGGQEGLWHHVPAQGP